MAAVHLSDELLTASTELERLQELLGNAAQSLMAAFGEAAGAAGALPQGREADSVRGALGRALVAMQFEDLATQIIAHVNLRLRGASYTLTQQAWPGDENDAGAPPDFAIRPCPVAQREMEAGSVDFF
jgi:hypothetical protein